MQTCSEESRQAFGIVRMVLLAERVFHECRGLGCEDDAMQRARDESNDFPDFGLCEREAGTQLAFRGQVSARHRGRAETASATRSSIAVNCH